ncbi:MAG: UDP-3-O-acyl-N-acetylglucosamine deacetylase, partial [Planctomycetota bacterium]
MITARSQTTLASPASVTGRGYWSGAEVRVEFRPAPVDSGIAFVRDDLGPTARVPLHIAAQRPTPRRTILSAETAAGETVSVEMVEHVAAALAGLGVDNCEVGVTAAEMPGMDGSSAAFVAAIDGVGLARQAAAADPLVITQPVRCERGNTWIEARPPTDGRLSIEFNLDFGPASAIPHQWTVLDVDPLSFRVE